jgi:hypothetical protein
MMIIAPSQVLLVDWTAAQALCAWPAANNVCQYRQQGKLGYDPAFCIGLNNNPPAQRGSCSLATAGTFPKVPGMAGKIIKHQTTRQDLDCFSIDYPDR